MKFPFHLPITDRIIARRIAAEFVRNEFNLRKVGEVLAPGLVKPHSFAGRLIQDREVRYAIGVIMDRVEKKDGRAEQFLKKMWEWLEDDGTETTLSDGRTVKLLSKAQLEMKQTAARILAKGYIREKGSKEDEKDTAPMVIQGLGDQIQNLTGETPVPIETDKEKVN